MHLPSLTEGVMLTRYKRFFADVRLPSGEVVVAHVPNTGSMKTCWAPEHRALLSPATNPERKLRWTLEVTSTGDNFILVNTALANKLAFEALSERRLDPFKEFDHVLPEQSIRDSRFDFLLKSATGHMWVEVKNVTLMEAPGLVSFPDAVSTRGQKHLKDLIELKKEGQRCAMLYVASRSDAERFTSAAAIDPEYARLLTEAQAAGVEVYCYRVEKSGDDYRLETRLPIVSPV